MNLKPVHVQSGLSLGLRGVAVALLWFAGCVITNWLVAAKQVDAAVGLVGTRGDRQNNSSPGEMQVTVGLGGMWKIGHITPVRVEVPASLLSRVDAIEVSTFDGDGVPVIYRQKVGSPSRPRDAAGTQPANGRGPAVASPPSFVWCPVTIGRGDRPLKVSLVDYTGGTVASKQLEADQLGKALPTSQPWMVAIGSSLGIEATSFTDANTGLPNFSTSVLTSADQVPDHWRGFDGCDLLIIASTLAKPIAKPKADADPSADANATNQTATNQTATAQTATAQTAPIAGLDTAQWHAIAQWIEQGGQAVLSLGEYAKEVSADSPLASLLPGPIQDTLGSVRTTSLEAATATSVQLAPISATRLKDPRGVVELAMLDNSGKRFPWWVRYSQGKGVMHFIASDLDQPVLAAWKDRRVIWEKLLTSFWARGQRIDTQDTSRNVSGSAYLGYDDLVGQLRATLDYFPAARVFGFGTITTILSVMLLVIGPVDYWVSVRLLNRPQFSWYLTGVVLLGTSIALIWLEDVSRPKQLLLNSAQIVDYLPERETMMVHSWTHIYSSRARTLDVGLSLKSAAVDARLDWQGLPGKGLGGMESNLLTDQGMPSYQVNLNQAQPVAATATSSVTNAVGSEKTPALISAVGIPASGTKCLLATWSSQIAPKGSSKLRELKGIDQVQGTLQNPLDVDLLRPVLLYHNWAYSLPSRLRAGEELSISFEMVPKDLLRRLNRRQIVNNNDQITRWNPEDRQSIDRLLEIMMFYKSAGGADYAKLAHRFQPRIDISPLLTLDHAVLLGELAEPVGNLSLNGIDPEQIKREVSSTWCRVLLPVARPEE